MRTVGSGVCLLPLLQLEGRLRPIVEQVAPQLLGRRGEAGRQQKRRAAREELEGVRAFEVRAERRQLLAPLELLVAELLETRRVRQPRVEARLCRIMMAGSRWW